jgi:2-keto-4-pentenoate hydratase
MAFVLARPLQGPGVTVSEAIGAVGFVLPALELIDSRIRDWKIGLADTIADNASSGGVVLGSTPLADQRASPSRRARTGCAAGHRPGHRPRDTAHTLGRGRRNDHRAADPAGAGVTL